MPITAPEGYLDISNATLRGSEIITTSNVGIMNANPTVALSVGSNLHVNAYSSNVLEVNGNVVAEGLKLGFIEILPSYDLAAVSNVGNVTQSTIQFSNATTAFVADSNIEVGTANLFVDTTTGNVGVGTTTPGASLEVSGNVAVSSNLAVNTDDLFVDTQTGRVGVGTTEPQKTLEVAGPLRITDGLSNVCDFSISDGPPFWNIGRKFVASDGQTQDYFGYSVSISGDGTTAIVGAWGEDDTYSYQGAAYIFTKTNGTWDTGTKIVATDGQQDDYFGISVSISGDGTTAIVGAYGETSNEGAAYIFRKSSGTWDTGTKIVASDGQTQDYFGRYVSISGDGTTAIVGAYSEDEKATDAGAAYIFDYNQGGLIVSKPITADGSLLSFTGQHICFPEGPMSQGLVVSANKNKYLTLNGPLAMGVRAIQSSEALPVVSLSNVASDRAAFGVVDHFEQGGAIRSQKSGATVIKQTKEIGDNRVVVNALGEGALWVVNTNGNLVSGDYITTSNVAGYGQRQNSEFLANYTVAKITMDCDFEPEDVPVQVILKDEDGKNVLDNYGRMQWVDTERIAKAYRVRYLDTSGQQTDEANAMWTAAYVGCTYHCG